MTDGVARTYGAHEASKLAYCWLALTSLALTLGGVTPAAAQHETHGAARVGYVAREVLEKATPLRSGIGKVAEQVSTTSDLAKAFYQQGVAYLHSYVWVEAARSFNQALRHDPNLAMAFVGLSRAYSGLDDPVAARAAAKRAQALSANASARERRMVEIRALQLDAIEALEVVAKHVAVRNAIDEALARDMGDVELWLLRGNLEEPTAAGRGQRGRAGSIAFYERVLQLDPDNFAAHHYLIHSYETIGDVESALKHGQVYARLAHQIPHARHMYGHDLRRVGRIDEAIGEFVKADELERTYYKDEDVPADYDWHHQHNLDLLSTSYQYLGQLKTAERLMREAFAITSVDGNREYQKRDWIGFLLGRGRHAEALDAARSLQSSARSAGRLTGHLGVAQSLLAIGRLDEAKKALADAQKEQQALPALAPGNALSRSMVEPEIALVRAEILLRGDDRAGARALIEPTIGRLRAQLGPDAWSQTLFRLERLAQVARELGNWQLAEYAAGQMFEHDPSYAGTQYALALAAERKGDSARAVEALALAARHWRTADPDLAELRDARAKLEATNRK